MNNLLNIMAQDTGDDLLSLIGQSFDLSVQF